MLSNIMNQISLNLSFFPTLTLSYYPKAQLLEGPMKEIKGTHPRGHPQLQPTCTSLGDAGKGEHSRSPESQQ